jgi:uncharacterized protein
MPGLILLEERLAVCRLEPDAPVPAWARGGFVSVTRTPEELSIVCAESALPEDAPRAELGWRVLQVAGPLDFELTGILSSISQPLAEADVPLFALSTYDTDYVLVREPDLERAVEALEGAGHTVYANSQP